MKTQTESETSRAFRLAVVATHPIQHFCPQYCSWARMKNVDLQVFFASDHGLKPYHDRQFDKTIHWEGLPMDFPHRFLPGATGRKVDGRLDSPELDEELAKFSPDALLIYGWHPHLPGGPPGGEQATRCL
jgi:hypothetical protein